MSIMNTAKAPTPKFFKIIRTVGIALAVAGGTLLTARIFLKVLGVRTNVAGLQYTQKNHGNLRSSICKRLREAASPKEKIKLKDKRRPPKRKYAEYHKLARILWQCCILGYYQPY